jgi:hypothetical protein
MELTQLDDSHNYPQLLVLQKQVCKFCCSARTRVNVGVVFVFVHLNQFMDFFQQPLLLLLLANYQRLT